MRVTKKVSGAKRIHRRERARTILAIADFKSPNEKLEDEDLTSEELLLEDPGRSDPGLGWPGLCLHTTASTSTTTTASTSAASTYALELAPPLLVLALLGLVPLVQQAPLPVRQRADSGWVVSTSGWWGGSTGGSRCSQAWKGVD